MGEFTPFEWGLIGFAWLMILLGVCYAIKEIWGKGKTKN